jgi:V/A-type H+-transporting ATPase subunit A
VAYWSKIDPDWLNFRDRALSLLEEATKIEETARIIGEKALPEEQRLTLFIAGIIKEGFLAQQAYHEVDTYCAPTKQARMLRRIIEFFDMIHPLIKAGVPLGKVRELPYVPEILRLKEQSKVESIDQTMAQVKSEVERLAQQYDIVT